MNGCSHQDCRNASNVAYSWPCLREPVPAPEPRCACGRDITNTPYHKCVTPAPEPSGRMSEEEFEAIGFWTGGSAPIDVPRLYAECRRARASEDAKDQEYVLIIDALRAERDALREKHQTATIALLSACAERDALAERVRGLEGELDRAKPFIDLRQELHRTDTRVATLEAALREIEHGHYPCNAADGCGGQTIAAAALDAGKP